MMDLLKWWFFNLLLFLLLFNIINCQNTCFPGIKTAGYTVPHGDILIEYGDPLDILCVLYDSVAAKEGPNASTNLKYYRNNEIVPQNMIEIINSTSIRLHVDKPQKVSGNTYTCLLNNTKNTSVCMNYVNVGTKPQLVEDFECIGYNYDNLTCTWTPPENYVKTEYNLTFSLRGRASRYVNNACPDMKYPTENDVDKKMSCFWNISTTPQYRQAHQEFYFTLTMKNIFGTNQINKTFKHFQYVLSGPPENLTALSTTPSSIYLYWMIPSSMQSFPPGVHHRVLYQCEYGAKKWHFGGFILNETRSKEIKFNLTGLKYAHALCDIRVSIRSTAALSDDEKMWSKNASITVRTSSKLPDQPPKTNIGSFEIVAFGNNLQYREAYIYWQQILEEQKNGPDFKYVTSVEGNDSMQPVEITNAYAKYKNLSISKNYRFFVWSKNADGKSIDKSVIYIPKQTERISEPLSFTKVEFGDGKYELAWEPPKIKNEIITNYTIFWCNNERDRPYQCTGKLHWKVIPSDKTVHNETVPKNEIYQFAISSNGEYSSSGMLWAACTVIHNKNMGKMKNVWINRLGSTFIEVGWKLDCSDRIGSVEGFIIYYCPIKSPTQAECKEPHKNITFYGDTSVLGGNITNLTPYTTYMLTVAVITKHTTFSHQSDPLFNTTLEAAPSTPPLNLQIKDVSNSSITLTWLPPLRINGMLRNYIIQYNNETMKIDSKTEITLNNLFSYENYLISITACTTMCSNTSETLNVTTKMGYPGKIRQPSVIFQNDSYITILWDKPYAARGRNDYYEIQIKEKHQNINKTLTLFKTTNRTYSIENCGDDGKYNTFYIAVRAVNLIHKISYEGPWSDELESYCRTPSSYMIYLLGSTVCIFLLGMFYLMKKLYGHCKLMRDVEIKLPPGLAPVTNDHTLVPWNTEKLTLENNAQADEELSLVKMNDLSNDTSCCNTSSNTSESGTSETYISKDDQQFSYVITGDITKTITDHPYISNKLPLNDALINTKILTSSIVPTISNTTTSIPISTIDDTTITTTATIPTTPITTTTTSTTSPYVSKDNKTVAYVLAGDVTRVLTDHPYIPYKINMNDTPDKNTTTSPYVSKDGQQFPYVVTGDAKKVINI